jgi:hypothetical protein
LLSRNNTFGAVDQQARERESRPFSTRKRRDGAFDVVGVKQESGEPRPDGEVRPLGR